MPLSAEAREERADWLRLVLTPGLGPAAVRRLLEAFGLPEDVFAAGRARLASTIDAARAQALLSADDARDAQVDAALRWSEDDRHHLVALTDPQYPPRLLAIGDPPPLLFVRGDPGALSRPSLAIVGSRNATRTGLGHAQAFARALADEGLQICSGLARGIDAAAHRGALAGRAGTLAVVGTGVDLTYPPAHAALADAIAERGAVVSELPLGTPVQRANFPRRNRLISGMSLGVLVVEAARQSGSLITARLAAEFGREVLAIPGSIHSPVSRGCHQLIREGAKLVESAEDVLVELRAQMGGAAAPVERAPGRPSRDDRQPLEPVSPAATALLTRLGWDPATTDELAGRTGQSAGDVSAALLELELAGLAERWVDGRYVRTGR